MLFRSRLIISSPLIAVMLKNPKASIDALKLVDCQDTSFLFAVKDGLLNTKSSSQAMKVKKRDNSTITFFIYNGLYKQKL